MAIDISILYIIRGGENPCCDDQKVNLLLPYTSSCLLYSYHFSSQGFRESGTTAGHGRVRVGCCSDWSLVRRIKCKTCPAACSADCRNAGSDSAIRVRFASDSRLHEPGFRK